MHPSQAYGVTTLLTPYSCRKEVLKLLTKLKQMPMQKQRQQQEERQHLGHHQSNRELSPEEKEDRFDAEVNAKVAVDAEAYYSVSIHTHHHLHMQFLGGEQETKKDGIAPSMEKSFDANRIMKTNCYSSFCKIILSVCWKEMGRAGMYVTST